MSSYLDKQAALFKSDAISAAPQIAVKTRLAAPAPYSAPSPAPSSSSATSKTDSKDKKRKAEEIKPGGAYSQPAQTGYGSEEFTQIAYVVEFLKKKSEPKTFKEILEYLSLVNTAESSKRKMVGILKKHGRVLHRPDLSLNIQTWDSGTFEHKPKLPVRSRESLIAYLQGLGSAQGISVKDIKDGWPDCTEAIDEMEFEHRLLVTRTKKDNLPRMVWLDDPTLWQSVELEFHHMWKNMGELPSVDEVVRKLQEAGQKPASEDPSKRIKAAPKTKEKKKRAARKGGKTTNTHMQHLLRDSGDLKRK